MNRFLRPVSQKVIIILGFFVLKAANLFWICQKICANNEGEKTFKICEKRCDAQVTNPDTGAVNVSPP